jgi:hypothetical protein
VGSAGVVVLDVGAEHSLEVAAIPHEYPVDAFGAYGPYEPFRVCVRLRSARWNLDDFDAVCGEHCVEAGGELAVAVAD